MTIEEITATLDRVAELQAKNADLHVGHSERVAGRRMREKRANESGAERASSEEAADKNEEPRAPAPGVKKGGAK